MACGVCGDDRALCRCSIEASPEGSVLITGSGEPGDPYVISAPGAGAGTRDFDRAAVYDPELDGAYLPMPLGYSHFDFYGTAEPRSIPGYLPSTFDGWYRVTRDARITLAHTLREENDTASPVTVGVPIPLDARINDLVVVSSSAPIASPPAGWAQVSASFFYRVLAEDDLETTVFWTVPPLAGIYLEFFTGVDPVSVQDAAPVLGTASASTFLTLASLANSTPGALLLSACTVSGAGSAPVLPAGMTAVNASQDPDLPGHKVASQLLPVAAATGPRTWTHTPIATNRDYTGVLLALRPAMTFAYYLWINGGWTAISGSPSSGTGASSAAGYAVTIGDGVHSTFTVPHALGTLDVLVECVNLETGQTCWPVVQRRAVDQVYLDFGDTTPAVGSRRVLINPL